MRIRVVLRRLQMRRVMHQPVNNIGCLSDMAGDHLGVKRNPQVGDMGIDGNGASSRRQIFGMVGCIECADRYGENHRIGTRGYPLPPHLGEGLAEMEVDQARRCSL
jgi:hypothetical protein